MDMMADVAAVLHQPANVLAVMDLDELADWWRRARDAAERTGR